MTTPPKAEEAWRMSTEAGCRVWSTEDGRALIADDRGVTVIAPRLGRYLCRSSQLAQLMPALDEPGQRALADAWHYTLTRREEVSRPPLTPKAVEQPLKEMK